MIRKTAIIFISLLLLNACGEDQTVETVPDESNEAIQTSSQDKSPFASVFHIENLEINYPEGSNLAPIHQFPTPTSNDSIQNNNLFAEALQKNNSAYCEIISDFVLRIQCEKIIDDEKILNEAIGKLDPESCEQINNQDKMNKCFDVVEKTLEIAEKEKQKYEDEGGSFPATAYGKKSGGKSQTSSGSQFSGPKTTNIMDNNNWLIETAAMNQDSPQLCNDINDQDKVTQCRYQVYLLRALNEQSPSICNQIGNSQYANYCKQNVAAAI